MTKPANLIVDISDNNGTPDLAAYWKAGHRGLGLKVTEGTSYAWDKHGTYADQWHKLGGWVIHYAFLHPGSGNDQARFFLTQINGHVDDEKDYVAADCEVAGVNGSLAATFLDTVHAARPVKLLAYGSPYFLRDNNVRPVHDAGLWLADYASKWAFIPPGWTKVTFWQRSQTSHITGFEKEVDLSEIVSPPKPPKPPKPRTLPVHVRAAIAVARPWLTHYAKTGKRPLKATAKARLKLLSEAITAADKVK